MRRSPVFGGQPEARPDPRPEGGRPFGLALAAVLCVAAALAAPAAAEVRFVLPSAPPGGDGLSWATAYHDLHPALVAAQSNPSITEIWVAAGTYLPVQSFGEGPRDRSFLLKKNLALLGGFAGDETAADQRDPAVHPTILSGDIGLPGEPADDAYHVVRTLFGSASSGLTAVLDGFTVSGGRADGPTNITRIGGGLFADGLCTIRDCRFVGNRAANRGGAIWTGVGIVVEDTLLEGNLCTGAGAAALDFDGSPATVTLTRCTVRLNQGSNPVVRLQGATVADGLFESNVGGAMATFGNLPLTVRSSTFRANQASFNAAGIAAASGGAMTVVNSVFVGNSALTDGAGAIFRIGTNIEDRIVNSRFLGNVAAGNNGGGGIRGGWFRLQNCIFAGNVAAIGGGLVGDPQQVTNCTFYGNAANNGAGGLHAVTSNLKVDNSIFWANLSGGVASQAAQLAVGSNPSIRSNIVQGWNGSLGGTGNSGADPLLYLPLGADGVLGTEDDDLRLSAGSPAIDAADATLVQPDAADVDQDSDLAEPTPLDASGTPRFFDAATVPDGGAGAPAFLDRGAEEFDPGEFDETAVWIGVDGGDWFDAGNWSGGAVPGASANVVIGGDAVIADGSAVASLVTVARGGLLTVAGGSLVADTISVEAGGGIALTAADATVEAATLTVAGELGWASGTVIVSAALAAEGPVSVGCQGPATLELRNGASLGAVAFQLCADGTLAGQGVVQAPTTAAGLVRPGAAKGLFAGTVVFAAGALLDGATLDLEIGGYAAGSFDRVAFGATVSGTATAAVTVLPPVVASLGGSVAVVEGPDADAVGWTLELPTLAAPYAFAGQTSFDRLRIVTMLAAPAERIHVDASAPAGGDGLGWGSAVSSLDAALDAAAVGSIEAIWVREGTYVPAVERWPGDPRSATFLIPDGLRLYGGFAGTESDPAERDIAAHPTVLSGDRLGDDLPSGQIFNPTQQDNCYRLLTLEACGPTTVVDGFTVTKGNANEPTVTALTADVGGGALVDGGSPTLVRLSFVANRAMREGAGLAVRAGHADVAGCRFEGNYVTGNSSALVPGDGGGLAVASGASAAITESEFVANLHQAGGGGSGAFVAGEAVFDQCEFRDHPGGRALGFRDGMLEVTDSLFVSNQGGSGGTALGGIRGEAMISGCEFVSNTFGGVGGAVALAGGEHLLIGCSFAHNEGLEGGAIRITGIGDGSGAVGLEACVFTSNEAESGGAVALAGAIPVSFVECAFASNEAFATGGAVAVRDFATPTFVDCSFIGNVAGAAGGAVHLFNNANAVFDGSTLSGNDAPAGSGIANDRSTLGGRPTLTGGDGLFNAGSLRPGGPAPASPFASVEVGGAFTHGELRPGGGGVGPSLVLELGGYAAGTEFDRVTVTGAADLGGGSLVLVVADGFVPEVGDAFEVLSAGSLTGTFASVGVAGAASVGVELTYTATSVIATVTKSAPPSYADPLTTDLVGLPRDLVLDDLDLDGDLDAALAVEGFLDGPSVAAVLRNGGADRDGDWLGFENDPFQVVVDDAPRSIAAGDFTGDGVPDLITANGASSTASVILSFAGLYYFLDANQATGLGPAGVATGQFAGGSAIDFAVANEVSGDVRVYRNDGSQGFVVAAVLDTGGKPARIVAVDIDLDGDPDLIVANTSDAPQNPAPTVTVHRSHGDGTFAAPIVRPIGRKTSALVVTDVSGDGLPDIVTGDRLDQGVSVIVADPAAPEGFLPTFVLPLGLEPLSVRDADIDLDGDRDLIAVLKPEGEAPRLQVIRNDTTPGGTLSFALDAVIPTPTVPEFATAGDLDGDGDEDLLVVLFLGASPDDADGGVAGGASAQLAVVLSDAANRNPADLNGDGTVGAADLTILLSGWGTAGPGDLNGDGVVTAVDLTILLGAWGS